MFEVPAERSTSLRHIKHDGADKLSLTFVDRRTGQPIAEYDYQPVPLETYHALLAAARPGAHFRKLLKEGGIRGQVAKRPFRGKAMA